MKAKERTVHYLYGTEMVPSVASAVRAWAVVRRAQADNRQILVEVDREGNTSVIVMAALLTARRPALRPGRFDRRVTLDTDYKSRHAILEVRDGQAAPGGEP